MLKRPKQHSTSYFENPYRIKACRQFSSNIHTFNKTWQIIIIEQWRNIKTTSRETETLKLQLRETEDVLIKLHRTLVPHSIDKELDW